MFFKVLPERFSLQLSARDDSELRVRHDSELR
jgi:hypothetical protein